MQCSIQTENVSLTHGQAALCVGCPSWGIPAEPQSREIAFAFSHLYRSKSTQPTARKVVNVADGAQTRYKGGYSGPRTLVITPTLSLGRPGGSEECQRRTDSEPPSEPPEAEQYCFIAVQSDITRQPPCHEGYELGLFQRNSPMSQKLNDINLIFFQRRNRKGPLKIYSKYSHNQASVYHSRREEVTGHSSKSSSSVSALPSPDHRPTHSSTAPNQLRLY